MSEEKADRGALLERAMVHETEFRLYARHLSGVCGVAADDLVQEAYVRILAIGGGQHIDNAAGYATRVIKNVALDAMRQRKIVSMGRGDEVELLKIACDAPSPERSLIAKQSLQQLIATIQLLPPQCRRVFTLRKVCGHSTAQVAAALGISISTAEKHLVKGLRLCAQHMQQSMPDWHCRQTP